MQVVINYNTPGLPKIYIHRVGRTARAGEWGTYPAVGDIPCAGGHWAPSAGAEP